MWLCLLHCHFNLFQYGLNFFYCCKVGDICTGRFQRTSNTNNSWADIPASVNIMAVLIGLTQTKGRRFHSKFLAHFGCFTLCQFCKHTLLFHLCAFVVWPFKLPHATFSSLPMLIISRTSVLYARCIHEYSWLESPMKLTDVCTVGGS